MLLFWTIIAEVLIWEWAMGAMDTFSYDEQEV